MWQTSIANLDESGAPDCCCIACHTWQVDSCSISSTSGYVTAAMSLYNTWDMARITARQSRMINAHPYFFNTIMIAAWALPKVATVNAGLRICFEPQVSDKKTFNSWISLFLTVNYTDEPINFQKSNINQVEQKEQHKQLANSVSRIWAYALFQLRACFYPEGELSRRILWISDALQNLTGDADTWLHNTAEFIAEAGGSR